MSLADEAARPVPKRETLGKLADLLDRSGIDLADVARVTKVKAWQGFMKGDDGEPVTVDMHGIELVPAWADGPKWPTVQQPPPIKAKPRAKSNRTTGARLTLLAPDPQFGFRRFEDGRLDTFHDPRALDLFLDVVRDAKPNAIVNMGDTLDLPEWSDKFTVTPEFVLTTQPTLNAAHSFLSSERTEAPEDCEIHLLEGNHDARMLRMVVRNVMAALRLKRANAPESWPVLTLQHLLWLDELGIIYHDGYPAGKVQITRGTDEQPGLYAIHGERTSVSAVAKSERQSIAQGHMHTIEDYWHTFELDGRPVHVNAFTMGCLCRTDGAVPSHRGGNDTRTGAHKHRIETWTQGFAAVTEWPDGSWSKEIIPIIGHRAYWRDKEYRA